MAAAADGRSVGRLPPDETALLVCDVQERFRPVISGFPAVVDTSRRMVRVCRQLAALLQGLLPLAAVPAQPSRPPPPPPPTPPRPASPLQLRAASALQLPVIVTEQYPKALGNTVEELQPHIPPGSPGERRGVWGGWVCVWGGGGSGWRPRPRRRQC